MTKESKFSQDFEKEVLHCLVGDPKFLKECLSIVRPDFMIVEMHASALKIILQSYARVRSAPSKIGFISELVQSESARYKAKKQDENKLIIEPVQQLADYLYAPLGNTEDVKRSWVEFCKQRETENILIDSRIKLESGEMTYKQVLENIRKGERRLLHTGQNGISDFFYDLDTFSSRIKELRKRKISTGFRSLDKIMNGGYSVDSLSTILASSKGGKSMFLVHTGFNTILYPYNVVHFTLEITAPWIELRYAARISGIPMDEAYEKSELMAEKCAEFAEQHSGKVFVKGYPPNTAGVEDFRSYLYSLENEKGIRPHLIIVDYGDLVKASEKTEQERFALANIWTELRALAQEFNCPVVTASQTNRAAFDKQIIRMSDIAEAIQKVTISDNIISICKTEDEDRQGKARLFFAGSREARTGQIIPVRFDWKTCFLAESTDAVQQEVYK